jgi:hypothetical protein
MDHISHTDMVIIDMRDHVVHRFARRMQELKLLVSKPHSAPPYHSAQHSFSTSKSAIFW